MIPGLLQKLITRRSKGTNEILRLPFSKLMKSIFYPFSSSYFIKTLQEVLLIKPRCHWPSTWVYNRRAMAKCARSSSNCTQRWQARGMRRLRFLFSVIRSLFDIPLCRMCSWCYVIFTFTPLKLKSKKIADVDVYLIFCRRGGNLTDYIPPYCLDSKHPSRLLPQ